MKKYVLDASVMMTAFLKKEEKVSNFIENILQQLKDKKNEIYSTSFMTYEVANALRFTLKDKSRSLEFFNKISHLPIKQFGLNTTQLKKAIILSYELKTTVYDTAYHYLARLLDGTFFTCDKEYYFKAKKIGNIELL